MAVELDLSAPTQNLKITRGDGKRVRGTITRGGVVEVLTNKQFRMAISQGETELFTNNPQVVDAAQGTIDITIPPLATERDATTYRWEIRMTDDADADLVDTIAVGSFLIIERAQEGAD
ncbi:MAG: hypothetical protein AAGC81_01925 [Pseudomonadota bacterium]